MVLTSVPPLRFEDFAGDAFVLAEDGAARFVAEAGHHFGVADEVGEEDGAEGGKTGQGGLPRRSTRPCRRRYTQSRSDSTTSSPDFDEGHPAKGTAAGKASTGLCV